MRNNYNLLGMLSIRNIAKQSAPAVVQTYMGRATRLTHIPRDKGLVHLARLGGYYNLKAYRHAHHLVGNTKGLRDYFLKNGVPKERAHYIGNFVEPMPAPPAEELKALRESLHIPDGAFIITCAARFHENKGLPDLIDAFSKVRNRLRRDSGSVSSAWKNISDVRLILVGDGPMAKQLQQQIRALNLEPYILLPGWRDPTPYYHVADILTSPSRHEPLGNTILEAWASGKPLVATATLGATELMTHEKNGLITPLSNPSALAEAFLRLMGDATLSKALADDGNETVTTLFSKQAITTQYLDLYEKLLTQA